MDELQTKPTGQDERATRSDAFRNFESSLGEVGDFVHLAHPTPLQGVIKREKNRVERQLSKADVAARNQQVIKKAVATISDSVDAHIRRRALVANWASALLVTLVYTYLEDSLALIAAQNPRLLRDASPPAIPKIMSADSLAALQGDIRRQWAATALLGGPAKWFRLLERLGARGYQTDTRFRLQHLWDTRNLIVHGRGIVTTAYANSQKNSAKLSVGDRLRVPLQWVVWWAEGAVTFVTVTDRFIVRYTPEPK